MSGKALTEDGLDNPVENTASSASGDDEEMLLEPRFKYTRILNNMPSILAKDSASSIAVHDKFIAIGSQNGYVYIIDHLGNLHPENTARHHRCAVTCVVVDLSGNYMISCASDARICICSIGSTELKQVTLDLKFVTKCVAISPDFGRRNSGQPFITGDRDLVLYEKKLFLNYRSSTLYQGMDRDGYILQISWHGPYVLFTNNTGSRVYDRSLDRIIALIQPSQDEITNHAWKGSPSHCWLNDAKFAVAWNNSIRVCAVIEASDFQRVDKSVPEKKVEVHYSWKLDMYIADISYTLKDSSLENWAEIVVFGLKKPLSEKRPNDEMDVVLSLLEPEDLDSYILTAEDRLEMRNCGSSALRDFHMAALPYESLYFLLAPKDFIEARPCSADDRVRWYVDNGMLREAMHYANEHENQLVEISAVDIGKEYVNTLIEQGKFSQAAACLKIVCGRKKDRWEYYVNEFEQHNVVLQLAKYIPTKDPQLEPESYQSILVAALYNHPVLFYRLIKVWNPDIYRVGAITDMAMKRVINDHLSEKDAISIYRSLASLYTYERKYEQALKLYLSMNDKSVFSLIERYHLIEMVKYDVAKLMQIDSSLALRLLIDNHGCLRAKDVISQLAQFPELQLAYLNMLYERNEEEEFADLAVELYAKHEPEKLLPFLRKSESYDIAKALDVCEKNELINEMVFLLGRSGNLIRALNLLIKKLNRIDLAIDFCLETDDGDLWEALIDSSMSEPESITKLLNIAGNYIDPLNIIEKARIVSIPCDMVIPGLRESLAKILSDYELQVQVQNGCRMVTLEDCSNLFRRFVDACKRPASVKSTSHCVICR
ncbi:unnamed protein product [Enterobius vermicularis]|uniref:Vacuolar protein sorting-associated protein 41 homolog n=1 Tax=Enterobius vermicularis TaxID=51028 RepID=A0A0N4UXJ6_ENTVE|nr:unnamed protein product [Enterobius vermicularis]